MNTWLVSDYHFSHQNVIRYDNRPFSTIEEMDETLIKNWNKVVKDGDMVYILGDFGLCPLGKIKEILDQLKGTKILILGNHDRHSITSYYNAEFSLVVNEVTVKFGKTMFKLSHYPYREGELYQWWEMFRFGKDYRSINKKRPIRGIEDFLIHGHTHSGAVKINKDKKQIHVGCWLWNYTPVNIQQIHALIHKEGK